MIRESVAYLVAAGREVIFDAEHFYDGWKQDAEYALLAVQTAVEAGAASVTLCDTNGGSMTDEIAADHRRRGRPAVRARGRSLPQRLRSGGGQHAGRRRGRGEPGARHDQRLRRALRQRRPDLGHRQPGAEEAGLRVARSPAASAG